MRRAQRRRGFEVVAAAGGGPMSSASFPLTIPAGSRSACRWRTTPTRFAPTRHVARCRPAHRRRGLGVRSAVVHARGIARHHGGLDPKDAPVGG
jgi:hypothetical protein